MAEQLALDQLARDSRHIDGDERAVPALAVVMQHARHEFLAGAALAVDHDGQIALRQAREDTINLLHRQRAADQRQFVGFPVARRRLALATGFRQRPRDDRDDLGQIEGLRQIFECALLGGRQRRHQRVLRAHHDDRQIGPELLDARDEIEGVFVRHHDIGDDDVAFALADPAPERRRVAGGARREARPGQSLVQHCADGSVVVGYENGASGHIVPLGARYRAVPRALHRKQHAKHGAFGFAFTFDDAAVIGDDLRDECEPKAAARRASSSRTDRRDAA